MIGFVDLFCGGGLGARGAVNAGCEPLLAVDAWEHAATTYAANFPSARVYRGKVEEINPLYVLDGQLANLLISSPECTNHSPAKGAQERNEDSRCTALQTIRWAKALKPRWIILENVPHIASWPRWKEIISELEQLGYKTKQYILDSEKFGVPQSRRRLFMVADLEGKQPDTIIGNSPSRHAQSILDPLGTWPTTPLYRLGRAERTIRHAERAISELGRETAFLVVYYGSDGSGGWQRLDSPLRTVTTLDRFALVEPSSAGYRMRMLQPPELARAMGLPPEHELVAPTRRDKVKLCGNGICAPVMQAVIEQTVTIAT
ncbi:MAG: DNA cytosine methyltransferase [Desulfovibrionaceae bacterium]|nr:DNA cytosine methyltransferase [Desulfovibrionaceae bacterium]